jgi:hypothetical protein
MTHISKKSIDTDQAPLPLDNCVIAQYLRETRVEIEIMYEELARLESSNKS